MEDLDERVQDLLGSLHDGTLARVDALAELAEILDAEEVPEMLLETIVLGMDPALKDKNVKVAVNAMTLLAKLIQHMESGFQAHHWVSVSAFALEKLGDGKDRVRELARDVLDAAVAAVGAFAVVERSLDALRHKNWRVKEEFVLFLADLASGDDARSLPLRQVVESSVPLLEDASGPVREAALTLMAAVYPHTGSSLISFIEAKGSSRSRHVADRCKGIEVSSQPIELHDGRQPERRSVLARGRTPRKSGSTSRGETTPSSALSSGGQKKASGERSSLIHKTLAPVQVYSERELAKEMKLIGETLRDVKKTDWDKRTKALERLGGIVQGGAVEQPSFFDELLHIKEAIAEQFVDPRSSVVRDAAMIVSMLARALGSKFEPLAETLLPTLLGRVVVTIAVIAESANECIREIVSACHAPRLVPKIIAGTSDKHQILRQRSVEYIVVLLTQWPPHLLERHVDVLSKTIYAALNDNRAGVRAAGRAAYHQFSAHWESKAARLLASLSEQAQKYLADGSNEDAAAAVLDHGPQFTVSASRQSMLRPPSSARRSARPSTAPSHRSATPSRSRVPDTPSTAARSSAGPSASSRPSTAPSPSATPVRAPRDRSARRTGRLTGPARVVLAGGARRENGSVRGGGAGPESTPARPSGAADAIAACKSSSWSAREEALGALSSLLRASGSGTVMSVHGDRIVDVVAQRVSDVHFKVALAALLVARDLFNLFPSAIKPQLERLVPQILARLSDGQQIVRSSATSALDSALEAYKGEDALLSATLRALDAPTPRTRVAALEFFVHAAADASTSALTDSQRVSHVLTKLYHLCGDRHPDVQAAAANAVAQLYSSHRDTALVALSLLPDSAQRAAKRTLERAVPGISDALAARVRGSPAAAAVASPRTPAHEPHALDRTPPSGGAAARRASLALTPEITRLEREFGDSPFLLGVPSLREYGKIATPPEERASGIPALLNAIATAGPGALAALHEIVALSREASESVWERFHEQVTMTLLDVLQASDAAIREMALFALREVLLNQGSLLADFEQVILERVLPCFSDKSRDVTMAAEETLDEIASRVSPLTCFNVLIPSIEQSDGSMLALSIRLLSKAASRCSSSELEKHMDTVFPLLFKAFDHKSAEVRKAVVFCIVDCALVLGDALEARLTSLTVPQSKLVAIYLNRARQSLQ